MMPDLPPPARDALGHVPVLPVLTIEDSAHASSLAEGLARGGLDVAEVTLRTPHALSAIRVMADAGLTVGAGTVRTVRDALSALDAGASFLISPVLDEALVDWSMDAGVCLIPGVATPSEAARALAHDVPTLKLFPASVLGGPAWLRAIAGPMPDARFIATGGITAETVSEYLAEPSLAAVGGSWFLPRGADLRDDDAIARGVRQLRGQVHALSSTEGS